MPLPFTRPPPIISFHGGGVGGELGSGGSVIYILWFSLELFGGVEESDESNGAVPFGGLVNRDECRR